MNLKERIIEKLLGVAKKHKLLTYPALALVAIISVIGYFFSWSTGAGKRVVALIMVMVMLVSQSYFLTSSATELIDTEETLVFQQQLQADDEDKEPAEETTEETTEEKNSDEQDKPTEEVAASTESSDNGDVIEEETMNDVVDSTEAVPESDAAVTGPDTTDWGIDEEEIDSNDELDAASGKNKIELQYGFDTTTNEVGTAGGLWSATTTVLSIEDYVANKADYTYNIKNTCADLMSSLASDTTKTNGQCYEFDMKWYKDSACTQELSETEMLSMVPNNTSNGAPCIKIYAKRNLKRFKVVLNTGVPAGDNDTASYSFTNYEIYSSGDNFCYIPVTNGRNGTVTINASRTGYNLATPTVDEGTATLNVAAGTIDINFDGISAVKEVTLAWEGKPYTIYYEKPDGSLSAQDAVYGNNSATKFLPGDTSEFYKKGETFNHWEYSTYTAQAGALVNSNYDLQKLLFQNSNSTSPWGLKAAYDYAGIVLTDGTTEKTIDIEYGVPLTQSHGANVIEIRGKYVGTSEPEASRFHYSVKDGSNITTLADSGVTVAASSPGDTYGILVKYDATAKKPVTNGYLTVTFTITDDMGDTDDNTKQTQDVTVKIRVKQRELRLIAPDNNYKNYDGTDTAQLTTSTLQTNTTGVTVGIDLNKAHYESKDVGDRKIIFDPGSLTINVPAGESASNYNISTDNYYVDGHIYAKELYVTTEPIFSGNRNYVRTGEADPAYRVLLDTAHHPTSVLASTDAAAGLDGLGIKCASTRTDFMEEGTNRFFFDVTEWTNTNYDVILDQRYVTKFSVKQDDPTGLYSLNATAGEDGWSFGDSATIVPVDTSGYDTVMISRDGGATWVNSGDITEDDSTNTNLKIKLWDSTTATNGAPGAITSVKPLSVSYDMTAPEYVGYSISEINKEYNVDPSKTNTMTPGLYFPGQGSVLDFGTYIKSTMTINIKYDDKTSGVNTLYYGLFGEEPTRTALFDPATGIATISIYKGAITGYDLDTKVGIIKFYAKDTAGNKSSELVLSPNGKVDYEWSIEEVGPTVGTMSVYYGENKDKIVSDPDRYYNHCEARVNVTDSVSGLERVEWYVNDTLFNTEEIHGTTKTISNMESDGITPKAYTCSLLGTELAAKGISADTVTVYAKIYDNAGNEKETPNKVTFKIDDVAPEYETSFDENTWTNDTKIDIITWDDLSGLKYARVTGPDGVTQDLDLKKQTGKDYKATINATTKGSYTLEISDNAENLTTKTWNIQRISTSVPECPNKYITFAPTEPNGLDGWYKKGDVVPSVTIKNIKSVDEGAGATPTDVTTSYRIWKEGESSFKYNKNDISATKDSEKISLSDDGVWHINAWAKSISGVYCHDNCEDNDHSDIKTIKIDCTEPKIEFYTEKGSDSSVIVHFTVTDATSGVNSNTIEVMHGNQKLDATVEAISNGYKGSFVIDEVGDYSIQAADNAGNASDKTAFTPMSMKIKAITNLTDNTATVGANIIKGTFDIKSASIAYKKVSDEDYTEADAADKVTADGKAVSAVLSGLAPATSYAYKITAVSDANEVLEYVGYFRTVSDSQAGISIVGTARYDDGSDGSITVGIFEGGICIMAKEVAAGSEFTFDNIPDGNYNIVATDGTYSKNMRLLIDNGMIVYPLHYIDLVLSGKNTSVVITTSDTPSVTADGMDSIFTDDYINFTAEDRKLIDNNGTVEFRLYATLMPKTSVSSEEISAMYAVTDSNKVVAAYLDLSLYKIVTDPSGEVTQSKVTNLANPAKISVTIPLGAIAGKPGLQVVRIHNDGENFLGSVLTDEDSNPNTYTISTNQFSTYAVLYTVDNEEVTTQETTVQQDTHVDTPTIPGGGNNTPVNVTPKTVTDDDDDEDVSEIKDKTKKPKESSSASTVGSLTSSGYAKTGDATPIVMLFVIMTMSCAAFIVLKKKIKEE